MALSHLDAILRYISENDYTHRENIAIQLSDYFEQYPQCSERQFTKAVESIRSDFFSINRINRQVFAKDVYALLVALPRARGLEQKVSHTPGDSVEDDREADERSRSEHREIIRRLDRVQKTLDANVVAAIDAIIETVRSRFPTPPEAPLLSGEVVMSEIRYHLIRARQERAIELLESLDARLIQLNQELSVSASTRNRFLSVVRELGGSVTAELIASALLRFLGVP